MPRRVCSIPTPVLSTLMIWLWVLSLAVGSHQGTVGKGRFFSSFSRNSFIAQLFGTTRFEYCIDFGVSCTAIGARRCGEVEISATRQLSRPGRRLKAASCEELVCLGSEYIV